MDCEPLVMVCFDCQIRLMSAIAHYGTASATATSFCVANQETILAIAKHLVRQLARPIASDDVRMGALISRLDGCVLALVHSRGAVVNENTSSGL
jgi:hypothetical protein